MVISDSVPGWYLITIDSTPSGIMEAASYLLTNHSLVAKAIERDEFKPEGCCLWKSSFVLDWWG
jgi:hypothetical protein